MILHHSLSTIFIKMLIQCALPQSSSSISALKIKILNTKKLMSPLQQKKSKQPTSLFRFAIILAPELFHFPRLPTSRMHKREEGSSVYAKHDSSKKETKGKEKERERERLHAALASWPLINRAVHEALGGYSIKPTLGNCVPTACRYTLRSEIHQI